MPPSLLLKINSPVHQQTANEKDTQRSLGFNMKSTHSAVVLLLLSVAAIGWGQVGHSRRFQSPTSLQVPSEVPSTSSLSVWEEEEEPSPRKYEPTWESLDARPLPSWYDESKVGVFFHWGVFSVPSFGNEWFWYSLVNKNKAVVDFLRDNYTPSMTYMDFARDFTAEFYDPLRWADTLKRSGAKYVVLTSKHHEGYTMWPSKFSFGWNVGDVGPKRDLLGDLAAALRNNTDIRFGVYHSWFEFYNPLYLADKANKYKTNRYVRYKAFPELQELVNKYKPEVIWSDGDWEASETYWKSKEFLAWLYNESPVKDTIVVNDRWGNGTACKHGGFFNCQDKYNPGKLQTRKWENAMTLDLHSWGYRRDAGVSSYITPQDLIRSLVTTVSCGGNFLINAGPTKYGMIAAIQEERLLQMGEWLGINGDAIYESQPWKVAQNDSSTSGVWYTKKGEHKVFAIILEEAWPSQEDADGAVRIVLGSVDSKSVQISRISVLGQRDPAKNLSWVPCDGKRCRNGILVTLPAILPPKSKWAWTLLISLQ